MTDEQPATAPAHPEPFRPGDEVADLNFDPAPVGVITGADGGTGWPLVAWAGTRSLVEVVDPARLLRTRPAGERGEPGDPALPPGPAEGVMGDTEPRPQAVETPRAVSRVRSEASNPKTIKLRLKGSQWEAWWKQGKIGSFGSTRTEALHNLADHLDRMDAWIAARFPSGDAS